jgi:hypothetical protein
MFFVIVPSESFGMYYVVDIQSGTRINSDALTLNEAKLLMKTAESIKFALRI